MVQVKRESCRWVARAKTRKSFWFRTCVFVAVLTALSPAGLPPSAPHYYPSIVPWHCLYASLTRMGLSPLPLSSVSAFVCISRHCPLLKGDTRRQPTSNTACRFSLRLILWDSPCPQNPDARIILEPLSGSKGLRAPSICMAIFAKAFIIMNHKPLSCQQALPSLCRCSRVDRRRSR